MSISDVAPEKVGYLFKKRPNEFVKASDGTLVPRWDIVEVSQQVVEEVKARELEKKKLGITNTVIEVA